ncbi:sensor histidine kinase [Couchioplanes caeruleus]|uniref:histidine kinase n=2 Tax=Couchioplanes caeruleus TaxID=56438 RepID=A0A1K0FN03_9ACTN|nr:histidine kinase [Couchioplanes caeruleus]OJF14104.1 histidine kinase [Couchioplanes caeruleus subsp. caeruleus]
MGELAPVRPYGQPEYRWLLPAVLRDEADAPPGPRSTRDWLIDILCFMLSLGWTLLATADLLSPVPTVLPQWSSSPDWLIATDLTIGIAFSVALWWRRRWPVHLGIGVLIFGTMSITITVVALISLFSVAVHRRFAVNGVVTVGAMLMNAAFCVIRPEHGTPIVESLAWSLAIVSIVQLWGMIVRARRELVVSLRDRVERAEAEQQLRVAQARALERTRIAREMHDVLAHRISLLSLHAGALEIRPDAPPTEVANAAGVIRASAHQALQDLREVIGVLREPAAEALPERPQPTLSELPALADESRAAGVKVCLLLGVDRPEDTPSGIGRTAYRIVQEGLTNARKHAPGTVVRVSVSGAAGEGLTVDIRNPAPVGRPPSVIPGTGTGLIGLTERATLAGGTLTHGHDSQGDFVLAAWLPWPD